MEKLAGSIQKEGFESGRWLRQRSRGGGKKKAGSKGSSVTQQEETWKFYEKMSFYKPYIYTNE